MKPISGVRSARMNGKRRSVGRMGRPQATLGTWVGIPVRNIGTAKGPDPGAALWAFVVPVPPQQADEDCEPDCETDDEIPDGRPADQPVVGNEPSDREGKAIDQQRDDKQVQKSEPSTPSPPSRDLAPVFGVVGHGC